jgi:hypothetical protein
MSLLKAFLISALFLLVLFGFRRIMGSSRKTGKARVERQGGAVILRLPRGHHVMLGSLVLGPTALLAVMALFEFQAGLLGPFGKIMISLSTLAGLAVFALFAASETRRYVKVDQGSIEACNVFGRKRVAWNDVGRISYNHMSFWFFLTGKDGSKIWVPESWNGVGDFAELALAHLPEAVLDADAVSRDAREMLKEAVERRDQE